MRAGPATLLAATLCGLGCQDGTARPLGDAAPAEGGLPDAVDAGPMLLAARRCDAPEPWAEVLQDYLAAGVRHTDGGTFLRAVHDLAVFEDRLYLAPQRGRG